MAEVPPTPLLPTRIGGWGLEEQSLLMDEGPIFGDDSMMEMTFEMSRIEDGQGDGDYWKTTDEGDESTETIMMSEMEREKVTVVEDQENWEVEAAREAGGHLDLSEPTFFAVEEDKDVAYHTIDQDDYYGDYPPSPFLDRSLWKLRHTAEPAQSITLPKEDVQSPLPPNIDISFNQANLQSPGFLSLSLGAIVPEDITFTARGDKPTLAEEERSLSLESIRSREVSLMVDDSGHEEDAEGRYTGNGNTTAKRPASSPRQSQEKKKSKQRSPTQDDYYTRRLSRSVSTTSMTMASPVLNHVDLPSSKPLDRSSSISHNAVAGPSRRISAPKSHREVVASPPIHGTIPTLSNPIGDEEEDVPPPRPSFLSRLIARSSILHPASTTTNQNPPYETTSGLSSTRDASSSSDASASQSVTSESSSTIHEHNDVEEVETARSRRVSCISSVHPTWDIGHVEAEDQSARFSDRSLFGRSTSRGSMRHDGRPVDFSISNMSAVTELSNTSPRHSGPPLPIDSHLGQSTSSERSRHVAYLSTEELDLSASPSISHPLKTSASGRLQISHRGEAADYGKSSPSLGSQSLQTSTIKMTEIESSLRRSTSQRVIGFFSDLLRTSTSSRSGSDQVQTPTPSLSVSGSRGQGMDGNELSVEELGAEDQGGYDDDDYEEEECQLDSRYDRRDLEESRSQYSANPHYITYMPPPPRYIPLTRPNKAPISHTASRAANPVRRPRPVLATSKPAVTSSFASAALARLPPPGKGCSSAGEKIVVKPLERATNLQARRALFEKSKNQPVFPAIPGKENVQTGLKSDKGIPARLEEKRKMREVEEQKKRLEEERAYREKRKETVVKARPVPDMYRRKLH